MHLHHEMRDFRLFSRRPASSRDSRSVSNIQLWPLPRCAALSFEADRSPRSSSSRTSGEPRATAPPPFDHGCRSACSSPPRLTPRAATRPAAGDFQMALLAGRPPYSNSRAKPTLTERTLPAVAAMTFAPSRRPTAGDSANCAAGSGRTDSNRPQDRRRVQYPRISRPGTLEKSFVFRVTREASAMSAEVAISKSIVETRPGPLSSMARRDP